MAPVPERNVIAAKGVAAWALIAAVQEGGGLATLALPRDPLVGMIKLRTIAEVKRSKEKFRED